MARPYPIASKASLWVEPKRAQVKTNISRIISGGLKTKTAEVAWVSRPMEFAPHFQPGQADVGNDAGFLETWPESQYCRDRRFLSVESR